MFHRRKNTIRKSEDDKVETVIKRRKKESTSEERRRAAAAAVTEDVSEYLIVESTDQKATAIQNIDTDILYDHRAILERNEKIGKQILEGKLERGIYRGIGGYAPILNKKEGAISAGKYTGTYGPVRNSHNNIRRTMRIDLNPEICKDYKETGYCGFGDTCIFIHDRSDYKSGWELEKEWEADQKTKADKAAERFRKGQLRLEKERLRDGERQRLGEQLLSDSSSQSEEEGNLPFLCIICKRKWTIESKPIITLCGHYFCEVCAIQHYRTSPKCFECGAATQGIFNIAHQIIQEINRRQGGAAPAPPP